MLSPVLPYFLPGKIPGNLSSTTSSSTAILLCPLLTYGRVGALYIFSCCPGAYLH